MRFKLWGTYKNTKKLLNETDSITDALHLQTEYRMAYGSGWTIKVEDIYDVKKTL